MYAIVFTDSNGADQFSHVFDTIQAARKWAKWMSGQSFASNVRIYRGGLGGELVK